MTGLEIHPRKPLIGFSLTNVTGTCAKGIELAHVKNTLIRNLKVIGLSGLLLSISDVTGTGARRCRSNRRRETAEGARPDCAAGNALSASLRIGAARRLSCSG
jgi:hypothetical protein